MQLKVLFQNCFSFIKEIPGGQEYDKNNIHQWLESDINDQGYQMLIVDKMLNKIHILCHLYVNLLYWQIDVFAIKDE